MLLTLSEQSLVAWLRRCRSVRPRRASYLHGGEPMSFSFALPHLHLVNESVNLSPPGNATCSWILLLVCKGRMLVDPSNIRLRSLSIFWPGDLGCCIRGLFRASAIRILTIHSVLYQSLPTAVPETLPSSRLRLHEAWLRATILLFRSPLRPLSAKLFHLLTSMDRFA
jgi:hypothetical protein